ncbi:MAG: hypothetical protein KDC61_03355, partial [Saprospiraceae bacterium]|nr:hypothetical protein [Saprospiraceae bacterium]
MNIKVANRKWYYPGFLGLAVAVYLAYQFISLLPLHREASLAKGTFQSPPPAMFDRTFIGEREAGGKSIPEAWLKKIHKAAPGDDWRAIESNSIRQLIMAKQSWNPG